VAQQELNLLEVSTGFAAELGAGPPHIMGAGLLTSPACRAYLVTMCHIMRSLSATGVFSGYSRRRTRRNKGPSDSPAAAGQASIATLTNGMVFFGEPPRYRAKLMWT